ncbi:hypothetical protein OC701_02640 ['Bonamia sp.' little leaf phytoplasma]|uniref:Uncharacterized protein n=2 Tax=Candidatus Phytoplasma bonamiae TaxID=2982626 RepID=A0ABT9D4H7_9MOLU|nr:hypothetical protein ['Bonamia sp.' little leaf phytoplasma]
MGFLKNNNSIKHQSFISSPKGLKQSNLSLSKSQINNFHKLKNIKSYFLENNDDSEKFLNDIDKKEKDKIKSLKEMFLLDLLKFNSIYDSIEEYKRKIMEFQKQIDFVSIKINYEEQNITKLKQISNEINKNINIKKLKIQNKKCDLQTQGITIYNNQEIYKIENEKKELIKKKREVLQQINKIKLGQKKLNNINEKIYQNLKLYKRLDQLLHSKKQFYIQTFLNCLEKFYTN